MDRALDGVPQTFYGDGEGEHARALVELADDLRTAFATEVPPARRERAMFSAAVGARATRRILPSLAVPAIAMLALIVLVGSLASTALPGQALYPVRKVLTSLNLADSPVDLIDARIRSAERHVAVAESHLAAERLQSALDESLAALADLGVAGHFVEELDAPDRAVRQAAIGALQARAATVIAALPPELTGAPPSDEVGGDDGREVGKRDEDDDEDDPDDADDDDVTDDTQEDAANDTDGGDVTEADTDGNDLRLNEADDETIDDIDDTDDADDD